jgi:hypothetical protein
MCSHTRHSRLSGCFRARAAFLSRNNGIEWEIAETRHIVRKNNRVEFPPKVKVWPVHSGPTRC